MATVHLTSVNVNFVENTTSCREVVSNPQRNLHDEHGKNLPADLHKTSLNTED